MEPKKYEGIVPLSVNKNKLKLKLKLSYQDSQGARAEIYVKQFMLGIRLCPKLYMLSGDLGKLSVKSNKSGFWRFLTKKLENFETRFWTCDT